MLPAFVRTDYGGLKVLRAKLLRNRAMAYFEPLKTSVMKVVFTTLFFFCATFGLAQNKLEVLGNSPLSENTTGSENVGVGFSAYSTGPNFTNSSALGYDAEPGASNTIRLGNDAVTTIGGNVDFTVTSDERFKTNVQEDVPGIEFIESLRPVTYHLDWQAMDDWRAEYLGERDSSDYAEKRDIEKIKFTGFLAQEVEAAAQKMSYDFSGVDAPDTDQQAYGLRYGTFVVPLVKATQEQQIEIRGLKSEVRDLKSEIGERKAEIEGLRSEVRDQRLEIRNQKMRRCERNWTSCGPCWNNCWRARPKRKVLSY
jgi:hypothetical protein